MRARSLRFAATHQGRTLETSAAAQGNSPIRRHGVAAHAHFSSAQALTRSTGPEVYLDGSGRPLAEREVFESRFKHNFSHVRIHSGNESARAARALGATAFTMGRHIIIDGDRPAARADGGQRLLSHELTHVVQKDTGLAPVEAIQCQRAAEESDEERIARQAQECVALFSRIVADADARGRNGVELTLMSDGRELKPGFEVSSGSGKRPAGTLPLTADSVAGGLHDLIGLIVTSGPGSWRISYSRDKRGIMQLGGWKVDQKQMPSAVDTTAVDPEPADSEAAWGESAEAIVAEVQASRKLVLDTAATLIQEQNPTNLDNLALSVAPFGIGVIAKVGKLARIGRLAKMIGKSGRRAFGETRFRGLVRNRKLADLTSQEVRDAFSSTPYKLSNHAIKRVREQRTQALGGHTLADIELLLNKGIVQESGGLASIEHRGLKAIVNAETGVIVTISPL